MRHLHSTTVTYQETRYSKAMVVTYGSAVGLPDFVEIVQIALVGERVHFIMKTHASSHDEHYCGYHLEKTDHIVDQQSLSDACHGDTEGPLLPPLLSMM